jgi:20S proteasome subunit beta 7
MIDSFGTLFEDNFLLSGIAQYMCQVLIQNKWKPELELSEAKVLIEECMKVCFCRDTRASDVIQIVFIDKAGVHIEAPKKIMVDWEMNSFKTTVNEKIHGFA